MYCNFTILLAYKNNIIVQNKNNIDNNIINTVLIFLFIYLNLVRMYTNIIFIVGKKKKRNCNVNVDPSKHIIVE